MKHIGRFVVRVDRPDSSSTKVRITSEGIHVWTGSMGDGVIPALGRRHHAFFHARWKTDDVLMLLDEVEENRGWK